MSSPQRLIYGPSALATPANAITVLRICFAPALVLVLLSSPGSIVPFWLWIGLALVLGAVAGGYAARKVRMTAMPQMVALFNGMGGGAAALVSIGELHSEWIHGVSSAAASITALLTVLIGSISFTGSLLAFSKLQEWVRGRPITFPGQKIVNAVLLFIFLIFWVGKFFVNQNIKKKKEIEF
jgi:NAD(P) transhydrogenase subunit beta